MICLKCLLGALDELVKGVDTSKIERVVLSTTLITNMIAEGKTDPVALVLIPGPGTNPKDYSLGEAIILDGAIDFRGKEIERLNESQIKDAASKIAGQGLSRVAVVGKFCQRNHAHELKVGEIMAKAMPKARDRAGTQGLRPAQLSQESGYDHAHSGDQGQIQGVRRSRGQGAETSKNILTGLHPQGRRRNFAS